MYFEFEHPSMIDERVVKAFGLEQNEHELRESNCAARARPSRSAPRAPRRRHL